MSPEFEALIRRERFHRAAVEQAMGLLPADDAELDRWVEEVVAASKPRDFMWLVIAALGAERPVDSRHLVRGMVLCTDRLFLANIAWQMTGDVGAHLVDATEKTFTGRKLDVFALLVAALWCREQRGGQWTPGLISTARLFARNPESTMLQVAHLQAVALITQDAGLQSVLSECKHKPDPEIVKKYPEAVLKMCRAPVLETLPDKPHGVLAAGRTMRRAVVKVGRNDTCPCGSQKKYKHCCAEQDRERLQDSTTVAGHTYDELWADPERHLTRVRLEQTTVDEMARFDPAKIPPDLREPYVIRLSLLTLLDRAAEAMEQYGYSEELKQGWSAVLRYGTLASRRSIVQRMVNLRADKEAMGKELRSGTRLLLVEEDPAALFRELEASALEALRTDDVDVLEDFAFGLLESRFRSLGIFVARSMVPILPKAEASFLFDRILKARDKLELSPDDPFSDVMDKRFLEHEGDGKKDEEAMFEAQRRLEEKAKEVRQLKESLDALQRQMERREKAPVETAATAAPDEAALREMRQKVEKLRSALKERHEERNELRRDLQKAHADLEALRQSSPAPSGTEPEQADNEEALLLPEQDAGTQPVRTIEFPRRFQEKLSSLPRSVARGTMTMLGRIAAGEPAAFVGAVRLKACPSVTRLRIGIDFRLLFRLMPDCVQVVDLIPRQDLERRIKTLLTTSRAA